MDTNIQTHGANRDEGFYDSLRRDLPEVENQWRADTAARASAALDEVENKLGQIELQLDAAKPRFAWGAFGIGAATGAITSGLVFGTIAWLDHREYQRELSALKAATTPANDTAASVQPIATGHARRT